MGKTLRFYHLVLGGFLLPMALVFFITGALFAVDYKGEKNKVAWTYQEKGAHSSAMDELTSSLNNQLSSRSISVKLTGIPKIKIYEDGNKKVSWEMGSTRVRATIKKSQPDSVDVRVRRATLSRYILSLHKVGSSPPYKAYAFIASIALTLLTILGFLMVLKDPQYRKIGLWSIAAGTVVFVIVIAI